MKSRKKTFKGAALLLAVLLAFGAFPGLVSAATDEWTTVTKRPSSVSNVDDVDDVGKAYDTNTDSYALFDDNDGEADFYGFGLPSDAIVTQIKVIIKGKSKDTDDWAKLNVYINNTNESPQEFRFKNTETVTKTYTTQSDFSLSDLVLKVRATNDEDVRVYDIQAEIKYKRIAYSVTYDANGGTGAPTDSNKYYKGSMATVKDIGSMSRPGWTFVEWSTKKDGSGTDRNPGQQYEVKGDTTFYAQWKQDKYTVSYEKGAHGTFATQSTGNLVYNSNTPVFVGTPAGEAGWTFAGWSPAWANKVKGNVTYEAQWTANAQTYTVHYYLEGTTTSLLTDKTGNGVTAQVINETAEAIPGYTAVAPTSQSLTLTAGTNVLTFYYTANPQTYTVKYLEQGSNDVLSADKPGSGVTGQVVNESAIDITGYTLAGAASQNLTLTAGTNEIIFYYTANAQTYTVNFLEKGTGQQLAPSVTKDTFFNEVIDPACEIIPIPGYYYAGASVDSLTVGTDNDANVINLYYKGKKVPYVVEHLVHVTLFDQEFDLPIALPDSGIGRVGKTATGYAKDIPGYTATVQSESITLAWGQPNIIKIYYTPNDQIYTVNYLEQGTNAPIIDPAIKSAKCGDLILPYSEYVNIPGYHIVDSEPWLVLWVGANDECNVINIYYERNEQTYTVNYLDKDTGDPIAPATTGTGIFGDIITSADEVIDIDGYTYDSADVETLTLGADDTANVINLYYASSTIVIPTTEPPLGPVETGTPTEEPTEGIVQVPDESVPAALPITGEASLDWMFLAGAIVLATGTLLLVFRKRKQGEK
jgi:LPXTG-motif cell wall-anchored protein/uncharacterized repeat protein (TIGR02543 family)